MATDGLAARNWLLLPGTLCTASVFDGLLDILGVPDSNREAITLDRVCVDDYVDICDLAGPDTIVCGFSLGAIVAAHLADRMHAHRLVLFGLNPHADDPAKAQGRHDLARDVAVMGGATAMGSRIPVLHGPNPDAARAKILEMANQTADQIDAQTELALHRPGALPALSRAGMRVCVLTGRNDTAAPPAQGRAAADAAPLGQFTALDGLGHFALLEDPKACAAALAQMEEQPHDANRH